ncbi:MAG: 2-oxo acid dehydrogenase subunit E2 [Bradyrhizobium sp.]|nr:2-oxo acid dehydrogenase subunit E2 [Bradyrhizobium sp.]
MAASVIMPQLGETVAEGKILTWFKSVGDEIREGDNLFEVETDKVTVEVQAIVTGRLSEIRVGPGLVARVGDVVAVVGDNSTSTIAESKEAAPISRSADRRSPFEEVLTPQETFGPAKGPEGIRITPLARRLISQNRLDLAALAADARRRGARRIDERTVRAALDLRVAASPPLVAMDDSRTPAAAETANSQVLTLNAIRLKTAERVAESWRTIPHVFQAVEVDYTNIDRVRRRHLDSFRQAHGFSLTYLPFVARATCLAIELFPHVNARFADRSLVFSGSMHLGFAVDLSLNGLVVPVIRDAGDLTLLGIAKAMHRLIDKARAGKLSPDDLSGGTYSISNNGAFGTTLTTPIINMPQVAILSVDAIRLKPAVVSTPEGDFVAPRMLGMLGQSFDHRAFDGAYSAAFLSCLKQMLETRNWGDELSGDAGARAAGASPILKEDR